MRSMALPAHDTSSFDEEDVGCGKRGTGGFFSTSEQGLDHPKRGDLTVSMYIQGYDIRRPSGAGVF